MNTQLIVALDVAGAQAALPIVEQLSGLVSHYKVGKELFVAEGPSMVRALQELKLNVFLDLKFHDIPNTVARASAEAEKLGVRLLTIHASGGSAMMKAARDAVGRDAKSAGHRPLLLAVTVLTSMDDAALAEIGVDHTAVGQVLHLARLAKASGMDGVVASVKEAQVLRQELGPDFLIVTPGVRPLSQHTDDQKRTATPREAALAGANYIVVGRPITASPNPRQAAQQVIDELAAVG